MTRLPPVPHSGVMTVDPHFRRSNSPLPSLSPKTQSVDLYRTMTIVVDLYRTMNQRCPPQRCTPLPYPEQWCPSTTQDRRVNRGRPW